MESILAVCRMSSDGVTAVSTVVLAVMAIITWFTTVVLWLRDRTGRKVAERRVNEQDREIQDLEAQLSPPTTDLRNSVPLNLRVPKETLERMKAAATASSETMTGWVLRAIHDALNRR